MLRGVLVGLISLMIASCMPMMVLPEAADSYSDNRLLLIEKEPLHEQFGVEISLQSGDTVQTLPLETYLVGVVLSEMPISFHSEALKAQAVAARTFAMKKRGESKHEHCDLCDQSSCCQAWCDPERMKEKLGSKWEFCIQKAQNAVESTAGQVITYDGTMIDAVYFSCSGGSTEAAAAVWGSDIPYLQTVKSPGEENASRYTSSLTVPMEQFRLKLPEVDLAGNPMGWFGAVSYTSGGGIDQMQIGGKNYSGTELRKRFDLNSTMFSVSVTAQGILFEVKGYGHRVGMSQYGADAMARQGKAYEEILQHYYPGAQLQKNSSRP